MKTFRSFTLAHASALLVIATVCWLLVVAGHGQRDEVRPTAFEKSLAIVNLLF